MAKTRSQTGNVTIKKEEEDHKDTRLVHSVNNTTGNNRKITKRRPSKNRNSRLPAQQVKVEENTDIKPLLTASPTLKKPEETQPISQEQIKQLIRYIVNDKMSVVKASKKANIVYDRARHYYNAYKNDPEKEIPVPKDNRIICTQEQITTPITSIVDDGMTLLEASTKANMHYDTGLIYYRKYKENRNINIPSTPYQRLMQERITKLIGYLADGKMSVKAASAKANMDYGTARKYYYKYLNDPNHAIPVADLQDHSATFPVQDQINKLISYIVTDKMSVRAAAKKAKLANSTALNYYQRYENDPNHRIPVARKSRRACATIPQDKIKQLISYITEDKMTIKAASEKAKMTYISGKRYSLKYRNDPNSIITTSSQSAIYTQEQISKLISFIVDDKMTVKDASAKTNMSLKTGEMYHQQYLNDLHHDIQTPTHIVSKRHFSKEQVKTFIRYIVHDKLSINAASRKANMNPETGRKYYKQYRSDPSNAIPTHIIWYSPRTQEQVTDLIRYIFEDKMSIYAASKKAKMGRSTASRYYHQYINNSNNKAPTHIHNCAPCTQEQVTNLIRYIVEDKMPITAASKKASMHYKTGCKYYNRLVRNHQ